MAIKSTAGSVLTAATQLILNQSGARIAVDGVLGQATARALEQANGSTREKISSFEQALGVKLERPVEAQPTADVSAVKAMISSLALQEGVPPTTALTIAFLESRFRVSAVSPTGAKGLFQLTSIAVRDVKQRNGAGLLPSVYSDILRPENNTILALRYMQLVSKDMGVPLRDTVRIYMGYNIGPSGALQVLAGQPERAAKAISLQSFGPPAVYAQNLRKAVESVAV